MIKMSAHKRKLTWLNHNNPLDSWEHKVITRQVNNRYRCEIPPGKIFEVPRPPVDEAIIHNWFNEALIKLGVQSQIAKQYEKKL